MKREKTMKGTIALIAVSKLKIQRILSTLAGVFVKQKLLSIITALQIK